MRRIRIIFLPAILEPVRTATALLALALPAAAFAGLELAAPEGIDLTGIWTVDPERSDDPEKALESLREQAKDRGRMSGGITATGGFGGMGSMGGIGAHKSGSVEVRDDKRERLQQVLTMSQRMEIMQLPDAVELDLDDRTISCNSTAKSQVSMPEGELADRVCGWDKHEFVVEFESTNGLKRTDRYSLGGDARTLVVSTSVRGGRMPELKLKSVYVRSESN